VEGKWLTALTMFNNGKGKSISCTWKPQHPLRLILSIHKLSGRNVATYLRYPFKRIDGPLPSNCRQISRVFPGIWRRPRAATICVG